MARNGAVRALSKRVLRSVLTSQIPGTGDLHMHARPRGKKSQQRNKCALFRPNQKVNFVFMTSF